MSHALRVALLVCVCLAAPAAAAPSSFVFSGTVGSVTDSGSFLDGSVAPGGAVTGTYDVDPTSADSNSPFGVGLAHLVFQVGSYQFDATQNPHAISLRNDVATGVPGLVVDRWDASSFAVPDLAPATSSSGDFGGYIAQLTFFDFDATAFDGSESAPFVPGDPGAPWDQVSIALFSVNGASAIDNRVKVQMNLSNWSAAPVPEPRSAALLALELLSLAVRERRRRSILPRA